jgi:hypothetical protein
MAVEARRGEARIHWLVAGRFTPERRGGSFAVEPAQLDRQLAERVPSVRVAVPDRIGPGGMRTIELAIRGLRSFTLAGVVDGVPELLALSGLGSRPSGSLLAEVERIAGPGKLATACREALEGAPAAEPEPRAAVKGATSVLDALARPLTSAVRSAGPDAARKLRPLLEAAIYGTALDALRSEPLRSIEASWRGLRMLLAACPARSGIQVELLDAAPPDLADLLRSRPESDAFDDPDAVFVVEDVASIGVLAELADAADGMLAPCVAGVAPQIFDALNTADLAARVVAGEALPDEWKALRELPAARWLCAAVNPLVLYTEGAGAFRRIAFGSPAWALAAMLSTSIRADGSVARIVGRGGALDAPAAWVILEGPHAGVRAPTEAFLPLAEQQALAAQGLLALGSVRDADLVVIAAAPMVGGDLPLPAQLLAGRIVRFARWTRKQLDPSLPPQEVSAIFQQAAQIFLFPGLEGAAALGAQVEGDEGHRVLHVAARVAPSRALVPLAIEFDLPM